MNASTILYWMNEYELWSDQASIYGSKSTPALPTEYETVYAITNE